ncbi:5-histidylcysteine sulfoxide synthase/putative 4-mercaptohistidine N1-methyltranferase [Nitrosomonas cryotolerans]|uniref:5-histidylcysteine sulfoxide synthase/putative 4-mercaptohistidine N1-methyltranferase n=1 Tax=Nitrosomonas cryotolerans ATCC 49181 TaxID=1131553 RepID=A0A1N6J370_9PROT|nr:5-histidylcysteine sulfoxide synthase [Nitrosomonas cryotolerans]SFP92651.1 5-histidylcysteine sulfoxide synthase/putative 4-mercaptohistidine N1-methyltranferase [Nitrosomonas cryotolerans]SIO38695.1 5-histidylcysteine sulfoxide synthase/putative 4-mercaptohistidine N1-methyltranferase [Nitrosomonas cryotolerans ATCC 49181]
MVQQRFQRTPQLNGDDVDAKRKEIHAYFHTTLDRYERLFDTLRNENAYYKKPITLRHPLIFYLGHTATFFINKLILAGLIAERINPKMESMFAVGVDEMSWDDLDISHYEWPAVEAVYAYRNNMRNVVDKLIRDLPLTLPITWESPWWAILMGIEHERIHLETSSVLIRQHAIEYVQPSTAWEPCRKSGTAPQNKLITVAAGHVQVGKNKTEQEYYGWDNEYGCHSAEISTFQASQYLVSNQEFLAFVEANGYTTENYWEEEGRSWQKYAGARHPTFWIKQNSEWRLRLMTEEILMPWDWPVEVNYHEAKAFCNWKTTTSGQPVRLPTEDEWYRLYDTANLTEVLQNEPAVGNLHLDYYASSCPVNEFPQGEFYDIVGNVWQWTETPTYPFEGFDVYPYYDDFTTPTFDNQHNLIKGGSWIACGNESLKSARYAFRRHFFQHAGFRYVVTDTPATVQSSNYETDKLLSEYGEFHYGDVYFDVPNFPKTLAEIAIAAMADKPARTALDLGCASGRSTFELAHHFDHVTGIDFSARFIGQGVQLAEQGVLRYTLTDEGDLVSYKERTLKGLGLDSVKHKVAFYQGDACNLKSIFTAYDLILAANLIDRLYDPAKLLTSIHTRLNTGGLLMITSPYTWLTEHTKKEAWIGGFKRDGENLTTLDGLKEILGPHFKLIQGPQPVPFVIRETKRKFQHTLAETTIWEKIS